MHLTSSNLKNIILVLLKKNANTHDKIALKNRIKKLLLIHRVLLNHEKESKVKRVWVSEVYKEVNRITQGASNNLIITLRLHDKEGFLNFFRMTPKVFDNLLSIVGPKISKKIVVRNPISATIRLQLTLRYLATGDNLKTLSLMFRVHPSTSSKIVEETCRELWNTLKPIVFVSNFTQNVWRNIATGFEAEWNFPNCLGCVDSKLITMQAPPNSCSYFYDYKGHHSVHLQAYVDAYKKFIFVEIGAAGRQSDGGVFHNSKIGNMIKNAQLNIPPPRSLVPGGMKLPHVFLGDEAFGLSKFMLTPYPRSSNLSLEKKVFNYRQSRARRIVECSFGELTSTWRLFRNSVKISLPNLLEAVKACVCLQNFLLMQRPEHSDYSDSFGNMQVNEEYQSLQNINEESGSERARRILAVNIRDEYANFFVNEGAVPFQWNKAFNNDF